MEARMCSLQVDIHVHLGILIPVLLHGKQLVLILWAVLKCGAKEGQGSPWQPEDLPDLRLLMDSCVVLP